MPENKNQHFVPQHYLRRFGHSNGKQICLTNILSRKHIPAAPIKDQCADDWFYGKDLIIEKTLLGPAEASCEKILKIICDERRLPTREEDKDNILVCFPALMLGRTREAANQQKELTNKFATKFWVEGMKRDKISPPNGMNWEETERCLSVLPENPAALALIFSMESSLFLHDLERKILIAPDNREFITSDHPAIIFNQAYCLKTELSTKGLAVTGTQLILPLSPSVCLFYFDKSCYRVGRPEKRVIVINPHDLDHINGLQVINAGSNLYFSFAVSFNYIAKLLSQFSSRRAARKVDVQPVHSPSGEVEGLYHRSVDIRMDPKWSFCHVKKDARFKSFSHRKCDANMLHDFYQRTLRLGWIPKELSFFDWIGQVANSPNVDPPD